MKTYIAPALHVQSIKVEMPMATSNVGMYTDTQLAGDKALGKERFDIDFESERTGWEDGLW